MLKPGQGRTSLLVASLLAVIVPTHIINVAAWPASAIPTITLSPEQQHRQTNISSLLQDLNLHYSHNLNSSSPESVFSLDKRQQGVIGTGICATAMQGFTCDPSNHEQNRCAGDNYSYCICAGSASLPNMNPQGLWLNTAWGPGCYACYGQDRGHVFDGTCNGNGAGGTGQCISDILATLTITITEWTYSTLRPRPTPTHTGNDNDNDGYDYSTTTTAIVTVTQVAGGVLSDRLLSPSSSWTRGLLAAGSILVVSSLHFF